MKHTKLRNKLSIAILAAALAVSFCGCQSSDTPQESSADSVAQSEAQASQESVTMETVSQESVEEVQSQQEQSTEMESTESESVEPESSEEESNIIRYMVIETAEPVDSNQVLYWEDVKRLKDLSALSLVESGRNFYVEDIMGAYNMTSLGEILTSERLSTMGDPEMPVVDAGEEISIRFIADDCYDATIVFTFTNYLGFAIHAEDCVVSAIRINNEYYDSMSEIRFSYDLGYGVNNFNFSRGIALSSDSNIVLKNTRYHSEGYPGSIYEVELEDNEVQKVTFTYTDASDDGNITTLAITVNEK